MVDTKAKPVSVAIDGCKIINIQVNRHCPNLLLLRHQSTQHLLPLSVPSFYATFSLAIHKILPTQKTIAVSQKTNQQFRKKNILKEPLSYQGFYFALKRQFLFFNK